MITISDEEPKQDFLKPKIRNVKQVSDKELTCEIKHPKFGWIPYTAIPDSGEDTLQWVWEQSYKKDLPVDMEVHKVRSVFSMRQKAKELVTKTTSKYSKDEIANWDMKRKEAENIISGGRSEILEFEASIANENVTDIAKKIIEKNDKYRMAVVKSEAIKRNIEKESKHLNTLEDIQKFINKYEGLLKDD